MQSTLVTFLLDRTGSMSSIRQPTIDSFNAYLKSLQEDKGDGLNVEFTLLQFDSISLDKICVGVPVAKAPLLNDHNFVPRDMTPLIDAAVKTIKAVDASLKSRTDNPKIVICFQTDGDENASREYTWDDLHKLIAEKTEAGWQFNFMGAGIDAYKQAARMGVKAGDTVSYDKDDAVATASIFTESAANTRGFGTGMRANTSYTGAQKLMAGDVFDPARGPSIAQPKAQHQRHAAMGGGVSQSMSAPLDLTVSSDERRMEALKAKPAVEDFSLGQTN